MHLSQPASSSGGRVMPQVDLGGGTGMEGVGELGMGREQRFQGGWETYFRESTLGPGWAESWETGQGTGLSSPRWLVLSRLRESSSWLLW